MKYAKTAMVLTIAMIAAFAIIPICDTDADVNIASNPTSDFDTLKGGSVTIPISNSYSDTFDVTIDVTENGKPVKTVTQTITKDTTSIVINMPDFKSEGTHSLTIKFTTDNIHDHVFTPDTLNINVEVKGNVLSNWTTYLVIIIAVIAIVVVVYLKMRDTPKEKNTMTFEQLEAERKAEMAAKSEKKAQKAAPASTEKKRYTGRKKD